MTKTVRVENGCTSDYKVVVEVWEQGWEDHDGNLHPDTLQETHELSYPTDLKEFLIYDTRYLKIKELSE